MITIPSLPAPPAPPPFPALPPPSPGLIPAACVAVDPPAEYVTDKPLIDDDNPAPPPPLFDPALPAPPPPPPYPPPDPMFPTPTDPSQPCLGASIYVDPGYTPLPYTCGTPNAVAPRIPPPLPPLISGDPENIWPAPPPYDIIKLPK